MNTVHSTSGRTLLLGDAANQFLPTNTQGVTQAIVVDEVTDILVVGQNLNSAGAGIETSRDGLGAIWDLDVFFAPVHSYSGFADGIETLAWSSQSWSYKHGAEQRERLVATHD
ncbi:hypothetical protein ACHAPQ_010342 [Fusarium lateritium]